MFNILIIFIGDTTTVFACVASRINSQNKAAERGLIITEKRYLKIFSKKKSKKI